MSIRLVFNAMTSYLVLRLILVDYCIYVQNLEYL